MLGNAEEKVFLYRKSFRYPQKCLQQSHCDSHIHCINIASLIKILFIINMIRSFRAVSYRLTNVVLSRKAIRIKESVTVTSSTHVRLRSCTEGDIKVKHNMALSFILVVRTKIRTFFPFSSFNMLTLAQ